MTTYLRATVIGLMAAVMAPMLAAASTFAVMAMTPSLSRLAGGSDAGGIAGYSLDLTSLVVGGFVVGFVWTLWRERRGRRSVNRAAI